jgi:hypothetical protein
MTEQEWLACADPGLMLEFLKGKASDRKLRLFACTCSRRMCHRWERSRVPEVVQNSAEDDVGKHELRPPAFEISERFADGEIGLHEIRQFLNELGAMGGVSAAWALNCSEFAVLEENAEQAAIQAISCALHFAYFFTYEQTFSKLTYTGDGKIAAEAREAERKKLPELVREIFGNPFRPFTVHRRWFTQPIVGLAKEIYDARAFERLPMLADALEEAGCTNGEILNHCRSPGPHVKGCWVVDAVLGKE